MEYLGRSKNIEEPGVYASPAAVSCRHAIRQYLTGGGFDTIKQHLSRLSETGAPIVDSILSLIDRLVDDSSVYRLSNVVRDNEEQINIQSKDLQRLQAEVAKLRLVLSSLVEILQESNLVNRTQVIAKLQEIDRREKLNVGVNTPETIECPSCHHQHLAGFARCIYCGESLSRQATGE